MTCRIGCAVVVFVVGCTERRTGVFFGPSRHFNETIAEVSIL